jgi:dTDP-4-amino-4,6-dideoxygalactose transaminase
MRKTKSGFTDQLPIQTETEEKAMRVPFSYLARQFEDVDAYLNDLRHLVRRGDFTLGAAVHEFERRFAALCGAPYAIGVGTGTDAIAMSLKIAGIGNGDEVITCPMTFIATVGAIVMTGARPVFVDSDDGLVIDASKIEAAITPRTRAIVPVHYTGNVADMPAIAEIARKHNLVIIEDACQAIGACFGGRPVGSWGMTACFSLHPLKNLNVWGDGGVIVTRSVEVEQKLRLYRNHGLSSRDEVSCFGLNCRLDTLQAVVGNRLIDQVGFITQRRIANAARFDNAFAGLSDFISIPRRRAEVKHVYHLYIIRARKRDDLLSFLASKGVEAKVHYPIPVHLQKAAECLGYRQGSFPVCEDDCRNIITLPAHQHLAFEEIDYVIEQVHSFYRHARN